MLTFPARVPGLNDSLVTFPALAIAVGEGQMRTVSAMDFGLGRVDRLSALPAEVGLALIGVMEPFTAPTARTLQNAYIAIRVRALRRVELAKVSKLVCTAGYSHTVRARPKAHQAHTARRVPSHAASSLSIEPCSFLLNKCRARPSRNSALASEDSRGRRCALAPGRSLRASIQPHRS